MSAQVYLSCEQSRRLDQVAVDAYGMNSLVLMENAGRGCADVLGSLGIHGTVVICSGAGNNAGDGFVTARHLGLRGHHVRVVLCHEPARLRGDAALNYRVLQKSEAAIVQCCGEVGLDRLTEQLQGADWIVDALLGTGAQGTPRPPLDRVIDLLNAHSARKMAVDLPSGLSADTGQPSPHTFRADDTCTFVAPKLGFRSEGARPYLGRVHVLDIGTPRALLATILAGPARDW